MAFPTPQQFWSRVGKGVSTRVSQLGGLISSAMPKPYTGPGSYDSSTGGIKPATAPQATPLAPLPSMSGVSLVSPKTQQSFNVQATPQVKSGGATTSTPAPIVTPPTPTLPTLPTGAPTPEDLKMQADLRAKLIAEGKIDEAGNAIPQGNAGSSYPIPAIPELSPETQKAVADTEKNYQDSLKISPGELSTQEDIDKLVESANKGFLDTKGQPIAMDFITGQLKAIEERAISMAEPLERKLARMQATRQSSMEASKFALERADKKLSDEKAGISAAKSDAESARRFGVEQAGAAESRQITKQGQTAQQKQAEANLAEQKRQADMNYKLSVEKFNEDKRQFGVNQAQENRRIAISEAKDAATASGDAAKSDSLSAYSLASELLDSGAINAITGVKGITNYLPGTKAQLAKNQFNQIKGLLSLENRQKLKGQGAVSDFEGKTLNQAASSLDTNLSNADFTAQLKKVRGAFATAAGLSTPVKVYDPKTRESKEGSLDRAGIESALSQGYTIEYQ